jgi:hypothetical protein
MLVLAGLMLLSLLPIGNLQADLIKNISDGFNDSIIDSKWTVFNSISGIDIYEEDKYLKVFLPADTHLIRGGVYQEIPELLSNALFDHGNIQLVVYNWYNLYNYNTLELHLNDGNSIGIQLTGGRGRDGVNHYYWRIIVNNNIVKYDTTSNQTEQAPEKAIIMNIQNGNYIILGDTFRFEDTSKPIRVYIYTEKQFVQEHTSDYNDISSEPDMDSFFVSQIVDRTVKYEFLDTVGIRLTRCTDGNPFTNASAHIENNKGQIITAEKSADVNGVIRIAFTATDTLPYYFVVQNTNELTQIERHEIDVDYKVIERVGKPTEVPVIKDNMIYIEASREDETKGITGIPGLTVTLTDNQPGGFYYQGITDEYGWVFIPAYLNSNRPLKLTIDGVGYVAYRSTIGAYMWSNTSETFGTNNQEHIVRKLKTDEMDMVYTTGESVVYGRSIDFGQTWDLEVLGRGTEPVLTRTASGLIAVWRDGMSSYSYSIKSSPWIPEDTLVNPAILLSEPVLGYNSTTSQTYLGYINHSYLQREEGDYILTSMNELNTDGIYYDTIVSYLGEYDKVPVKSPVFSLYNTTDFTAQVIGFIDTSTNYIAKIWNTNIMQWTQPTTVSNANQICNAPTTDYYGDATSFVYEAVNTDETKDIYRRKLSKGIIDANAVKVNVTMGKNEYPKASNGIFINYINNSNKLITNYSGNDISVYTGADSIHTTEFETKPLLMTKVRGYHIWSEGSNGNYRIKWMTRDYYPTAFTFIESEPEDTVETVTTSPLYEYIAVKEPVEQLNTTINGLNPEMNYTVKVITSEGSPVKPQIIQIDGEVYAVVTGHTNRPDTTEITLPKETYQDYSIVVSIDRKRGNPNRDAEVLVYQYETDGEEVVAVSNKIKIFAPITESKEINKNIFTIKDKVSINYTSEKEVNVEVRVYDVSGREVTSIIAKVNKGTNSIKLSNIYKTGVYFAVLKNGDETETSRINIIK